MPTIITLRARTWTVHILVICLLFASGLKIAKAASDHSSKINCENLLKKNIEVFNFGPYGFGKFKDKVNLHIKPTVDLQNHLNIEKFFNELPLSSPPQHAVLSPSPISSADLLPIYERDGKDTLAIIASDYQLQSETLACGKVKKAAKDLPFGDFLTNGTKRSYADLPERVKHSISGRTELFFGRQLSSVENALAVIERYFTFGVDRRGGHNDVTKHQSSTDASAYSGFSIHTESFGVAARYAHQGKQAGIVFVIDTEGLELLNLNNLQAFDGGSVTHESEAELLSRGGRNPKRIQAAILFKDQKPSRILMNPHYESRHSVALSKRKEAAARRFVDPEDWEKVQPRFEAADITHPEQGFYDQATLKAWENAIAYMEMHASTRLPTLDDMIRINQIALAGVNTPHLGYFLNRASEVPKGMHSQYMSWVKQGRYTEIEEKFNIRKPVGDLRTFGALTFNTFETPKPGTTNEGVFSLKAIEALQRNPLLTLNKKAPAAGTDIFSATFSFPAGEKVIYLTVQTFWSLKGSLDLHLKAPNSKGSSFYERAVRYSAADFYYSLVSIHPFWDGNGRTAKIMRDWVLLHFGLPPPAYTPSNDLELSGFDLGTHLKDAMEETQKEFKDGRLKLNSADLPKLTPQ